MNVTCRIHLIWAKIPIRYSDTLAGPSQRAPFIPNHPPLEHKRRLLSADALTEATLRMHRMRMRMGDGDEEPADGEDIGSEDTYSDMSEE